MLLYNTTMKLSSLLDQNWYEQDVVAAARGLLGKRLVRLLHGQRTGGIIVETEAYRGEEDLACHARSGRTPRTVVMYGPPGRAYVYFTYGLHWLFNVVCMPEGYPAAVLVRAIIPDEGLQVIAARRAGRRPESWADGPAKLTQALAIDGNFIGCNLTQTATGLWIEDGPSFQDDAVLVEPRVGIEAVAEPWRSLPWRFRLRPEHQARLLPQA